jgi:hypothetical protein
MKQFVLIHAEKYLRVIITTLFLLQGAASFSENNADNILPALDGDRLNSDGPVNDSGRTIDGDIPVVSVDKNSSGNEYHFMISGFAQLWYVYERNENDKQQSYTADPAVDETSGFGLNKVRLTAETGDDTLSARITLGFDNGGTPVLLDCYGSWAAVKNELLIVYAGQMKIPSTWESAVNDSELDFITRGKFSSDTANWSLCKSPSSVSPFTSVETNMRDIGIAVKGNFSGFSYSIMASNGLGSNLAVGGPEKKGYLYANRFGEYFYGVRAEYDVAELLKECDVLPFINSLSAGMHYNYNIHNNVIYNDTRTVLDIKRNSYSVDTRLVLFDSLRLSAMYGHGTVDDDYDNDGETDLDYSGYDVRIMWMVLRDLLEIGVRYDEYTTEKTVYGSPDTFQVLTAGINCFPYKGLKIQINYKLKNNESELKNDIDDDSLVMQMQYSFQWN